MEEKRILSFLPFVILAYEPVQRAVDMSDDNRNKSTQVAFQIRHLPRTYAKMVIVPRCSQFPRPRSTGCETKVKPKSLENVEKKMVVHRTSRHIYCQ